MDKEKPQGPVAPIKDSNGNGFLDGEDIRAALKAEEKNGQTRDASERAHGVLEMVAFRTFTETYNKLALEGKTVGTEFDEAAKLLKVMLTTTVKDINELADQAPDQIRGIVQKSVRAAAKDKGLSEETTALNVADADSLLDFATTFKATFPNGITLEAKDMPELMAHFGQLMTPLPEKKEPKKDTPITRQT